MEPGSSEQTRDHIVRALEAMLVGPFADSGQEVLPMPPSRWYLTGFLAPEDARVADDPTDDETVGAGDDTTDKDGHAPEPEARRTRFHPASIGVSVLLKDSGPEDALLVQVSYGEYQRIDLDDEQLQQAKLANPSDAKHQWKRYARQSAVVRVPLDARSLARGIRVPGSALSSDDGLMLVGHIKEMRTEDQALGLPAGTCVVSLFLVNKRTPMQANALQDQSYVFQVQMKVEATCPIIARPNPRDAFADGDDQDALNADLQFREVREFATGHGIAVESQVEDGAVVVYTRWLPQATVKRVVTHQEPSVTTNMEVLAQLEDGEAAQNALMPLVGAYLAWIQEQSQLTFSQENRQRASQELMKKASRACARIREGILLLATDPEALRGFKMANAAMAQASRQRNPERYEHGSAPTWRLFQLAFLLMNLPSACDPQHPDRETVDLIFFPTGGGKTEAYLGVIAFTLLMRRMRGQERPDKGLGVAVLLRYTLRLLTLDQLGRAATLICALELMRQKQPKLLGEQRFSIGLWVGRSATANKLTDVAQAISRYKSGHHSQPNSPFPLTQCPWCNSDLTPRSFTISPSVSKPQEVRVHCSGREKCEFKPRSNKQGLPVLFVDEQIYRELPCFLVATVDKFALMPWRGETGKLFGRVHGRKAEGFCGPMDEAPGRGVEPLPQGLRPPELIVQDELHLISGPLGTMVGLYETVIDALCEYSPEPGVTIRPRVLASTATVKRAREHIRALFAREDMAIFPPQGVTDSETWFARVDHDSPGRLYLGVAAAGKPNKAVLLRVYTTLLNAAQRFFDPKGPSATFADPYMTLVGYFNSLRELGGMRRLVEDEVRGRCSVAQENVPLDWVGDHPWLADRQVQVFPVELTSRESTHNIKRDKARLELPRTDKQGVDVALASNMISVGVDIDRLGLMVVAGQPKTTSEYIQASSRVGRDVKRPGLVVTCYNLHKPRDRSHYEHFMAYHASFYRYVEANSLTPFSGPAMDRGLAGATMALARLMDPSMTPPTAAQHIEANRAKAEEAAELLARRAAYAYEDDETSERVRVVIRARVRALLDQWEHLAREARDGASLRAYSPWERHNNGGGKPLLRQALEVQQDPSISNAEKYFVVPTSMRDVEPAVHIWVQNTKDKEEDHGQA